MIYIIGIKQIEDGRRYLCFDADTESPFELDTDELTNYKIINMKFINNEWILDQYFNEIHHSTKRTSYGSDYILLCKLAENIYKIVDYTGKVEYILDKQLLHHVRNGSIANCKIEDEKIISIGTYKVTENAAFIQHIKEKYELYIAKTSLLGYNMSFDYIIEGDQVKLVSYTGTSKRMIIPKFITTVIDKAFWKSGIETLTFDIGIKHIGRFAFAGCNISEVIIPDTVEIMGKSAFFDNKKLYSINDGYINNVTMSSDMVSAGVFFINKRLIE